MNQRRWGSIRRGTRAFTLVELLTVVAIIALLIGILVPALSRARTQAKKGATQAILKALGDGLDMFRNDNPEECRPGEGYPSSQWRDDPTEPNEDDEICGAQWLVRYLLGKTLDGYIPRRDVPRAVLALGAGTPGFEQAYWYDYDTTNNPVAPLKRKDPYITPDRVALAKPMNLMGFETLKTLGGIYDDTNPAMQQPVFLDAFGYPILYYAANTALYRREKMRAPLAGDIDTAEVQGYPNGVTGIYSMHDNGLFTGMDNTCPSGITMPEWPLGPTRANASEGLMRFGTWTNTADHPATTVPEEYLNPVDNQYTFPNYILNKTVFDSTKKNDLGLGASVVPYRPDSFLLISPGADGLFGNEDDVSNFAF